MLHFLYFYLDNFNCQYLKLDDFSMVNTELISFEMFDCEQSQDEKCHRDGFQEETGDQYKFNLCVSSVKVVHNLPWYLLHDLIRIFGPPIRFLSLLLLDPRSYSDLRVFYTYTDGPKRRRTI